MKLQFAIIGSPGSGKTVLTAVLSKYLSGHSDRVYMNPKGTYQYQGNRVDTVSTISYVTGMLDILHKGGWPPGTPPDHKFELGFELNIGGNAYEMKLLDSGGEDLQAIWLNYDKTALTPFRQKLFDYILSSNAVVLIVNLDHFADAPTLTARGENENVLKEAVDNLVEAGECHYILVCFTAYDKYKAHIDQTYRGNFINYLRGELPMFYRSCEVARNTVVRDYSDGQKMVRVDCIAVAPVIAQSPTPGINPERVGKPPIGFDIRNSRHSWGINQMADWLCMCEQSEREWSDKDDDDDRKEELRKILFYRVFPIIIGAIVGVLACIVLMNVIAGHPITETLVFNSLFLGVPIGAGIGFLIGDKLKVLIAEEDGLVFKINRGDEDEEQEDAVTSRPTSKSRTSTTSSRPSGTGGTSTASPRPSSTSGASTSSPRPSGTGGTAATSGSETLD